MSTPPLSVISIAVICCATACSDSAKLGEVRRAHPKDASTQAETEADASASELRYFVGDVTGSDIRVGIAQASDRARVFFCGGPSSYEDSTRWVVTELAADGGFEFDDGGWKVSGQLTGDAITGVITINDQERRAFTSDAVRDGTIAGLYEGEADCGRVGLIVTQATKNDQPSAQGACVGTGHLPEQVNPILPVALKAGEIKVEVSGQASSVHAAGPAPAL